MSARVKALLVAPTLRSHIPNIATESYTQHVPPITSVTLEAFGPIGLLTMSQMRCPICSVSLLLLISGEGFARRLEGPKYGDGQ